MTHQEFTDSIDEVFGAGAAAVTTTPAILIRVNDIPGLVKSQGGAVGALVQKYAPDTITSQVYTQMASKMSDGLKQQGVNADVQIVNWPQPGATPFVPDNTVRNVVLGAGGLGALGLLYYFFGRSPRVTR